MTSPTLAFLNLGMGELIVFGVVALLIFGEKLPEAMRNFGKAYVKFRRGISEASRPVREEIARIERDVAREATGVKPPPPPPADVRMPYPTGAPEPPPPRPLDEPPPV